ncbi:MAG: histidine phosphatase family protein [Phycisphaeraceae bacterium]|nr:histidine phosphatase family protein [Phycisphaeraceae bacterium]
MPHFTLMRHGQPAFDAFAHRTLIGGCHDWIPLSPQGIEQVHAAALDWRQTHAPHLIKPFDLILASPMTRALHTAALVSRILDLPMHVEFDLHEWLPDLTFRYESFAPVQQAIDDRKQCHNEWPPGQTRTWEPFSQVRKRATAVLERYTDKQSVLVVCHHTLIQALTGQSLDHAQSLPFDLVPTGKT